MAAKKNNTHDKPRTHRVRQRKNAAIASEATETPACAEVVPTQAAQAPAEPAVADQAAETPVEPTAAEPTAESSRGVSATPAAETTAATADSSSEPTASAHQLSALDAAAKVLGETGQAMSCPELITAIAAKGYWSSPKGRTPASTLYSAILRELKSQGEQPRFVKSQRGKFALRRNV